MCVYTAMVIIIENCTRYKSKSVPDFVDYMNCFRNKSSSGASNNTSTSTRYRRGIIFFGCNCTKNFIAWVYKNVVRNAMIMMGGIFLSCCCCCCYVDFFVRERIRFPPGAILTYIIHGLRVFHATACVNSKGGKDHFLWEQAELETGDRANVVLCYFGYCWKL